jgi:hypothetical protein
VSDGDWYDRCPDDGCVEVEANFRSHGTGTSDLHTSQQEWATFNADRRQGGCGFNWSRTNATGIARDAARGVLSARPTRAAQIERSFSTPSAAYQANYEAIFGHA